MSLQDTYNKFNKRSGDSNLSAKPKQRFSSEMIVLFAALFISCAVMFYGAAPIHREAEIIKFASETKTEDIEVGKSLLLKIVKINSENKGINSEEIKKVGEFIPNRDNYEDYLTHIVSLANNKNIKINSFSISKDKDSGNKEKEGENGALNKMSIDIAASGFFLNFMSFTRDIENGIPFICEKSISISKSESDDSESLDYGMNIEFYHY